MYCNRFSPFNSNVCPRHVWFWGYHTNGCWQLSFKKLLIACATLYTASITSGSKKSC